ncbi:MAG: hypothetical protein ACREJ0_06625, partial [Geminicoccaceae bacterium]
VQATLGSQQVPATGLISCPGAMEARHASKRSAGVTAALSNPAPVIDALSTLAASVETFHTT